MASLKFLFYISSRSPLRSLSSVGSKPQTDEMTTKIAIRHQIKETLVALTPEEKKRQSQLVFEKLLKLVAFQNSERFSTFLSIDNEIDTEPLVKHIFENGKQCFVPRYNKKEMEMVKLSSIKDCETLPLTKHGIKQPKFTDQRENALETGGLDFVVVPGVAFTKLGHRLGHGGGYYDRFLTKLKRDQESTPILVALAFREQILDFVPTAEHDVMIDLVLYPD